jgi:DNA-directed RNA polymerase specialized sigma24 family protein
MTKSTPHPSPWVRSYHSTGSHLRRSIGGEQRPRRRPGKPRGAGLKLFQIATRWDLISRARAAGGTTGERRTAQAEVLEIYRPALIEWIKVDRGLDDGPARELVQAFLVRVIAENLLARADRERGRLSNFLSACLRNQANTQARRDGRQVPLPEDGAELPSVNPAADRVRDRKLANGLVTRAKAKVFEDHYAKSPEAATLFDELIARIEGEADGERAAALGARLGLTAKEVYTATDRLKDQLHAQILREMAAIMRRKGRRDVDDEIRLLIAALEDES